MRRALATLALVLGAWAAFAVTVAPAAQIAHAPEGSFNGADAPGGPFDFVLGVEADRSGGPGDNDVWVAELEEASGEEFPTSVSRFDEDGRYAGVTFDGADTPDGSFGFVNFESQAIAFDGLAVDSSAGPNNGDVYVSDAQHGVVNRFDAAGQYECQITGRALPSASECAGLAGSAVPDGSIIPTGIVVDDVTGNLFVSDPVDKAIYEFDQSGQLVGQIVDPHAERPGGLAIDSTGALYVVNQFFFEGESVVKFDPSGNFVAVVAEEGTIGVGVDPSTDHVYVSQAGEIVEFDAAGAELGTFSTGEFTAYPSLTVNGETGRLYAGLIFFEDGSKVDMFSPVTTVPDASVEPAASVTETTASLSGEVDPAGGGDVVACRFEYGTEGRFQHSAPCVPAPTFSSPTAVTADLTGLDPSTNYEFRLAATNGGAPPYTRGIPGRSEVEPLATIGPPTVEEESESGIERTAATLHAKINPRGFESEFRFEYVDAAHFETEGFGGPATRSTAFSQIGDGQHPLAVAQGIGGLEIDTTYHYRAVARNERGEGVGPGRQLTTRPVGVIERQWAYARIWEATAEASIDPIGFATSCRVEYVEESSYQASGYADAIERPCLDAIPAGPKPVTARAEIPGLEIDTTYHFRFVATNASGTVVGDDKTFSTFGIDEFSIELVDENGDPYTQAGGHPYEKVIRYTFHHTLVSPGGNNVGSLNAFLRSLITEEPVGETVASLDSTPECPGNLAEEERCPADTQVGEVRVEYIDGGGVETTTKGVYNVTPPEGVANRYATVDPYLASDSEVRSDGDYGITVGNVNITEEARIVGVTSRIWGIPADHNGGGGARAVTLRNPTTCDGPRKATARVDSWDAPGTYTFATTELAQLTGCDKLEFHPGVEWRPTSTVADSPTGLHVNIHQDQRGDPDGVDFADLRTVLIRPLDGVLLNPSAANGLVGCAPADVKLRQRDPASCPDASKVGTVRIVTPLTDHPLDGGIYIATPRENPFGSLFALYLAVHDRETGVVVKLAGEIATAAGTGQLTAGFGDNPQFPVEDFELDFFDGPRAVVRTPPVCGTFQTEATLTPWSAPHSGPPARRTDSYAIASTPGGGPCFGDEAGAPHRPELRAGTTSARAGAFAPFVLRLQREDGAQRIAGLSVTPPPGLLARLRGVERCGSAALAAAEGRSGVAERARPSCPDGSRVGTAVVAAGAGSDPYYAEGGVYLGGPYRDAPLSLAVVVPAVAGPFDLGTVVVRTPLRIDLETGEIGVESDRIPTVLEGVALDVRTIAIKLDRPGFTINPTGCDPAATELGVTSLTGQALRVSDPFQVVRCRRLGFEPQVQMRLRGETHRSGHPSMRTVLKMPKGGANIARVEVTLPPTAFLDNSHIRGICTRPEFAARACAPGTIYGRARAWSPLLPKPLGGPVFMRSSERRLPNLVAELNGEVRLAVVSHIGSAGRGIRVKAEDLPDAPVEKFVMTMQGGERGLLQNSVDVCAHPQRARVELEAHNGKVTVLHPLLRARC